MFNHHSIIPWGSFRGRQEEKWGSFRGWDHFGVGIISGLGSFRGRDHFGGYTGRMKGQDVMTSNVACHAMLWIENSNEHPKTLDQQKHNGRF